MHVRACLAGGLYSDGLSRPCLFSRRHGSASSRVDANLVSLSRRIASPTSALAASALTDGHGRSGELRVPLGWAAGSEESNGGDGGSEIGAAEWAGIGMGRSPLRRRCSDDEDEDDDDDDDDDDNDEEGGAVPRCSRCSVCFIHSFTNPNFCSRKRRSAAASSSLRRRCCCALSISVW